MQLKEAHRHGIHGPKRVAWIHRKFGGEMVVWRVRKDGTLGCSIPCVLCRKKLIEFGIRVHVVLHDVPLGGHASWFHGLMSDVNAPISKPTSGQIKRLNFTAVRR